MLDFHTHLLPGIDDGSMDISMSVAMLNMWRQQGVDIVCATPHFYADVNTPGRFLENRRASFLSLRAWLNSLPGGLAAYPEIILGAEVHYFRGMSSSKDLRQLCLQGTNLLLIEMSFREWSDYMLRDIAEIHAMGLVPVMAHIERYLTYNTRKRIDELLEIGALLQCNAEFFLSQGTRKKAFRMLSDKQIHFLGSDAHNTSSRLPNMGEAVMLIKDRLGPEALSEISRNEGFVIEARKIAASKGVMFT